MSLKPTRPCKRCYANESTMGPRGELLQFQTHPETGTSHRAYPTWEDVRGWGFRSLCGVPIIFWKPAGQEGES